MSTATALISEPNALTVSATNLSNVSCFGGNNGSISITSNGGTPAYSYTWMPLGIGTGTTISNLPIGTYTVNIQDTYFCKTSLALTITQPALALTSSLTNIVNLVCFSSLGAATSNPSGGTAPYTYTWSSTPVQNSATAIDLLSGSYTVNVQDANGCVTSNTVSLAQPTQVIGTTGLNDTICLGQTATINCTATGGGGSHYFVWQPGSITNAGVLNPSPLANTTYTVVSFDQNGCASTPDFVEVVVHTLNANNIQTFGVSPICPGEPTILSVNVSGNTGAVTYSWSNGLGNSSGPIVTTPPQPMYYYITALNSCGLSRKDSVYIDFYPLPTVFTAPSGSFACVPNAMQFFDNTTLGTPTDELTDWSWDFGDGQTSNEQNPYHEYNIAGTYSVTLTVVTDAGCTNNNATTPLVINAYQSPLAQFTLNATVLNLPQDYLICNNLSIGAVSYNWSFGDGNSSPEVHPHYLYNTIGSYEVQLIATSLQGCTDTAYANVVTGADIVFPNAFTPNADGGSNGGYYTFGSITNDVFFPYTSGVTDYKLQIFNRWGEMIFESTDIKQGWDGYYKGKICQLGVYIWKAYAKLNNGKIFNQTGDVTLLR